MVRPRLDPKPGFMGFAVDIVALGHDLLGVPSVFPYRFHSFSAPYLCFIRLSSLEQLTASCKKHLPALPEHSCSAGVNGACNRTYIVRTSCLPGVHTNNFTFSFYWSCMCANDVRFSRRREALVMLFRWLVFALGNGWSQMSSMKVPCPEMEVESVRSLHGHVNWWMWSVSLLRVLWWFLFFLYLLRTFSSYMPLFFVCNMLFIHNTCFFCWFVCLFVVDTGSHITFFLMYLTALLQLYKLYNRSVQTLASQVVLRGPRTHL